MPSWVFRDQQELTCEEAYLFTRHSLTIRYSVDSPSGFPRPAPGRPTGCLCYGWARPACGHHRDLCWLSGGRILRVVGRNRRDLSILLFAYPVCRPILIRHRENSNVQGFVKGAYGAAIGTILGACVLLGKIAIGDWLTAVDCGR